MMKYLIVIEETHTGFSAYTPDFDGCVATGCTVEEVEKKMKEAIEFHLEGLAMENLSKPTPHTCSGYIEVG